MIFPAVSAICLRKWATTGLLGVVGLAVFGWHFSLLTEVDSGPHLAAVGFGIFSDLGAWLTFSLSWIVTALLVFGAWMLLSGAPERRVAFLLLATGGLALTLQLLTVEKRLVFNYFPSFALMATGLAFCVRSHTPLLMLVVSLYFAAATHKLVNFPKLLKYIPETIAARLPHGLVEQAPGLAAWLPKILSFIVIPLEYTMAICLAVPRLRIVGFALALTFHTMVSSFTNDADALSLVGFFVLYAHGLQFLFFASRPVVIGKATIGIVGMSLLAWFAFTHPDFVGVRKAVALYLPIAFLVFSVLKNQEERARLRAWIPELPPARWTFAWGALLILWCLYPAMMGYRSQQYGWAMMSGAHLERPIECIKLVRDSCADRWFFEPQVKTLRRAEELVFASSQPKHLEQVARELRRRCGVEASALGHFQVADDWSCRVNGL